MTEAKKSESSSRPYHHGNLREALLSAAVEAIGEHGVAGLKLRDLARRVGVSHGAPANHFRDRNALLVAIAIEGYEKLAQAQRNAIERPHPSPMAALNAVGVAYVEFAVQNPAHFEVMFRRELQGDPELMQAAARCFQLSIGAVGGVRPTGRAPSENEFLATLGSWALVHGLATLHAQGLLPSVVCNDLPRLTQATLEAMVRIVGGEGDAQ
ncbi:MAG: TetR/AcrR family transcriptional regulator [Myxococcales bacterium]|nr:TetR/AcrR family transcriptional regulator [Myxococcales bacterium]